MTAIEQLTEALGSIIRDAATQAAREAIASVQGSQPRGDRIVRVRDLVEAHPGLTQDMIYKQISRRETNGLLGTGALVQTKGGRWRIHEGRYLDWLDGGCDR